MTLPLRDAELVQIMDAALERAAACAGSWLACRPGCTQCCHGAFPINLLDVERLRTGMRALRARDPELAGAIEQRAAAWLAEYGPGFPGDRSTGILGTSDEQQALFEDFADDAPCPALDPDSGRCDVYAWRPMTCRVFGPPVRILESGALTTCELCFDGAANEQIAACEMPVPHDLEARLVDELGPPYETVVAYALLRSTPEQTG